MHSTDDLDDGYCGSGVIIKAWIKKYGKDEFWNRHAKTVDEFCVDRKVLEQRESEIISPALLSDKQCLNLSPGGKGGPKFTGKRHTDEAKRKVGDFNRGRAKTQEQKRRMAESRIGKTPFMEKQHTQETKSKQSLAKSRQCTVNGIDIYSSRKALIKALGKGKFGLKSPTFRYVMNTSTIEDQTVMPDYLH